MNIFLTIQNIKIQDGFALMIHLGRVLGGWVGRVGRVGRVDR